MTQEKTNTPFKHILFILLALVFLAAASYIISTQTDSNIKEEQFKKLQQEYSDLLQSETDNKLIISTMKGELTLLKLDKKQSEDNLAIMRKQLNKYKNAYTNIPDYRNLSADSISRLFSEYFNY